MELFLFSVVQYYAVVSLNIHPYVIHSGCVAGVPKQTWQCLIGAALSSYNKSHLGKESDSEETSKFLHLAKRYRSSLPVLSAVADYLDFVYG